MPLRVLIAPRAFSTFFHLPQLPKQARSFSLRHDRHDRHYRGSRDGTF